MILAPHLKSFLGTDGQNSIFGGARFQGTSFDGLWVEIWTPEALKNRFRYRMYCNKNKFPQKSFFQDISESSSLCFGGVGNILSDLFCLEHTLEIYGFAGACVVQHSTGAACKSRGMSGTSVSQTLTVDLQPAASGPMIAEKQPTWRDDFCAAESTQFPKPAVSRPSKGAHEFMYSCI